MRAARLAFHWQGRDVGVSGATDSTCRKLQTRSTRFLLGSVRSSPIPVPSQQLRPRVIGVALASMSMVLPIYIPSLTMKGYMIARQVFVLMSMTWTKQSGMGVTLKLGKIHEVLHAS